MWDYAMTAAQALAQQSKQRCTGMKEGAHRGWGAWLAAAESGARRHAVAPLDRLLLSHWLLTLALLPLRRRRQGAGAVAAAIAAAAKPAATRAAALAAPALAPAPVSALPMGLPALVI
jgi:hypothetical protein